MSRAWLPQKWAELLRKNETRCCCDYFVEGTGDGDSRTTHDSNGDYELDNELQQNWLNGEGGGLTLERSCFIYIPVYPTYYALTILVWNDRRQLEVYESVRRLRCDRVARRRHPGSKRKGEVLLM
ncbi:hypothetical protein Q1695_016068 [Nippostrongylus brasiliensis]|nr:hypothetical protein Q1695_016068 [Nippostrongylus brasiliensis]